ncbi:MAG: sulfate transporter, partial [Candidatus Rokubacteria bacterium]|nr:sulfate transporter [Candidatus Rokubacteria bacterium]
RYDRFEFAGAFGDLGTLIPFLDGNITISRLDPVGVLVGFGLSMIATGLYFKRPVPVQPMKAIATAAISRPELFTAGAIWASALFTGVFWLLMGLTGTASWIARVTSRPVVNGIVLGLGLSFVVTGVRMMEGQPVLALAAVGLTFVLLSNERVPAMPGLLAFGVAVAVAQRPGLVGEILQMPLRVRLPEVAWAPLGWSEVVTGVVFLGLPQTALTLGNAIIATVEEHNTLFPGRPLSVKAMTVSHGVMNLFGGTIGGVPMCHGAGGLAGHVRFGARTGGALVILGAILLAVGLTLGDSVGTLFKLFPPAILGTVLLFGGLELAASVGLQAETLGERYVMALTAGIALWNMGVAYLAGMLLWVALERGWLHL